LHAVIPVAKVRGVNGTQRIRGAIGLVIVGGFALVFLGTEVTHCLGPLGRTLVQSIQDGCLKPGAGIAMPAGAAWVAAAALLLLPIRRSALPGAALGAIVGGVIVGVAYGLQPPTSLTGPTSYGDVITVVLPFDWNLLLAAVIGGATLGLIVGSRLPRSRSLRLRT
jgi:hypothetical protein